MHTKKNKANPQPATMLHIKIPSVATTPPLIPAFTQDRRNVNTLPIK